MFVQKIKVALNIRFPHRLSISVPEMTPKGVPDVPGLPHMPIWTFRKRFRGADITFWVVTMDVYHAIEVICLEDFLLTTDVL